MTHGSRRAHKSVVHLAQYSALLCALLFITVMLVGCPGNLEDPDRFKSAPDAGVLPFTCPSAQLVVKTEILIKRCGNSGCHDAPSMAGGLDLVSPGTGVRVANIPSAECAGKVLIHEDGGYLLDKLHPTPGCGAVMPLVGIPLTASEEQCLAEWAKHVLAGGFE